MGILFPFRLFEMDIAHRRRNSLGGFSPPSLGQTVIIVLWSFFSVDGLNYSGYHYGGVGGSSNAFSLCPRYCPMITDPVCGSDGNIYASECELRRRTCRQSLRSTAVVMLPLEECSKQKGHKCYGYCFGEYDPVCGADGKTYKNKCLFSIQMCNHGTRFAHYGSCTNLTRAESKSDCPSYCIQSFPIQEAVCASDGNVYRSECEMKRETCGQNVVPTTTRHCQVTRHCKELCRKFYEPVCGSDGRIYSNSCQLKLQNCGRYVYEVPMSHCYGTTRNKFGCPTDCRNALPKPVCGSDGKVYANECELRMLRCGYLTDEVKILTNYSAECLSRENKCMEKHACEVSLLYDPHCGSNGRTYPNKCELEMAYCLTSVELSHLGECYHRNVSDRCPGSCPDFDPNDSKSVCGSDGNVYPSICELKLRTCNQKVVPLANKYCQTTSYCDVDCSAKAKPVCGSDGQPYKSACQMFKKNCGKHIHEIPMKHCLKNLFSANCWQPCPTNLDPVCANDGKTYSNECFLEIESCRTSNAVRLKYYGLCGHPVEMPSTYKPKVKS